MRYREYVLGISVLLLTACSAVSPRLDAVTGTTLEQRCGDYRAGVAALDAVRLSRELTEAEQTRRNLYEAFIAGSCPPLPALE